MAKESPRSYIIMKCTVCGLETKRTEKNKRNNPDKLELNLHCKNCRKHTPHKEKK